MSAAVGEVVPVHATAIGKAIMSVLPTDRRASLLAQEPYRRLTANTMTTRDELERELSTVQVRGYAIDDEEAESGAMCIAAPVLGGDGYPLGAISISGPRVRMLQLDHSELAADLRLWCDWISNDLGRGWNDGTGSAAVVNE
jgi:DNA-binding IclR family transcriptional regulator